MAGVRRGGHVHTHDVRHGRHRIGGFHRGDAHLGCCVAGERATPGNHVHAEGASTFGEFFADSTHTDDAEGLPVDTVGFGVLTLVPSSGAEVRRVVRNAPIQCQDESKGEFRHGDGVHAGTVGHVDATPRGCGHVDRIVPRTGADDEAQPGMCGDRLLRNLG